MRNALTYVLLLSSLFFLSNTIHAQDLRRYYATQKVNQRLLSQVANHAQAQRQFRQFLATYQHRGGFETKTIPIIFHVVYQDESERISEAQVYSQIEALNRDFSQEQKTINHLAESTERFDRKQADDIHIRFCLANIPNNIHYVQSEIAQWSSNDAIKFAVSGGADVIAPDRAINVWIGRFEKAVSGYAQFPLGQTATDGIAIDYRFFGTMGTATAPYDEGKTLSHLVANYLGVPDIWNEWSQCGDDYIYDTPIHNSPNFGCPPYKHVSTCGNLPVEMTMNLMDNTNDACQYQFTYGQRLIMTAVLSESGMRHSLIANPNTECSTTAKQEILEDRTEQADLLVSPKANMHIRPNPANDQLTIRFTGDQGMKQIKIFDLLGKMMYANSDIEGEQFHIDLSALPEGMYILSAKIGEEQLNEEFVITRS